MKDTDRQLVEYRLRDGRAVLLGPVGPQDKQRLRDGIARLSRNSRYLRFFSPTAQLTEEQLDYLVNVDQVNHVAWGALEPVRPHLPGLGLGRFVRDRDQPEVAEMAVAVVDDWQGRGLGTVLLGLLWLSARHRGITALRSLILPENDITRHWLIALGAAMRNRGDHFECELPVVADLRLLPETASAQRFAAVVAELQTTLRDGGLTA